MPDAPLPPKPEKETMSAHAFITAPAAMIRVWTEAAKKENLSRARWVTRTLMEKIRKPDGGGQS